MEVNTVTAPRFRRVNEVQSSMRHAVQEELHLYLSHRVVEHCCGIRHAVENTTCKSKCPAVAAAVAVAVAVASRCGTMCRVFSLHCLSVCLPLFLPSLSCLSASSALYRVSPTESPSRPSSAPLLAARQTLRLPLALCMLDPSSIRAIFHHVMCLFGTSSPSCTDFLFSSSLFTSTHSTCVLHLSSFRRSPSALLLSSSSRLPCALTSSSPSSRALPSSSCSSLSLFSSCSPLRSLRCSS